MKIQCSLVFMSLLFAYFYSSAQTPLPYYTGFDDTAQQEGWMQYRLGAQSEFYQFSYSVSGPFSGPTALAHSYPVGGSEQTDDWFVSPEFDFSFGGMVDSLRYTFSGFGTPNVGDTLGIYLLSGSQNPAEATVLLQLYSFADSNYVNDNVWRKTLPFDIPAVEGESYIAFRYSTVTNWLDVKFDNLALSGQPLSVSENSVNENLVHIYPNPCKEYINIDADNMHIRQMKLIDMHGNIARTWSESQNVLDLQNLACGPYVLQVFAYESVLYRRLIVK